MAVNYYISNFCMRQQSHVLSCWVCTVVRCRCFDSRALGRPPSASYSHQRQVCRVDVNQTCRVGSHELNEAPPQPNIDAPSPFSPFSPNDDPMGESQTEPRESRWPPPTYPLCTPGVHTNKPTQSSPMTRRKKHTCSCIRDETSVMGKKK